jgi:hypothetical protein
LKTRCKGRKLINKTIPCTGHIAKSEKRDNYQCETIVTQLSRYKGKKRGEMLVIVSITKERMKS